MKAQRSVVIKCRNNKRDRRWKFRKHWPNRVHKVDHFVVVPTDESLELASETARRGDRE